MYKKVHFKEIYCILANFLKNISKISQKRVKNLLSFVKLSLTYNETGKNFSVSGKSSNFVKLSTFLASF